MNKSLLNKDIKVLDTGISTIVSDPTQLFLFDRIHSESDTNMFGDKRPTARAPLSNQVYNRIMYLV